MVHCKNSTFCWIFWFPINTEYEEKFLVAEYLESATFHHPNTGVETSFISVGSLRQELKCCLGQ